MSKQLLEELRNDGPGEDGEPNPEPNIIYGTYIDKDSSEKPDGVMSKVAGRKGGKMLKVSFIIYIKTLFLAPS